MIISAVVSSKNTIGAEKQGDVAKLYVFVLNSIGVVWYLKRIKMFRGGDAVETQDSRRRG